MWPLPLALLVLEFLQPANALKFDVDVRRTPERSRRVRRDAGQGADVVVMNSGDITYSGNITMGGNTFTVLLDTGSSDLILSGDVPGTKSLGVNATVTFVIGQSDGAVNAAKLAFGNYTVQDQAYIVDLDNSNAPLDGLLGLGPPSGSRVRAAVGDESGDPMIARIFAQNKTSQNFLSLLLSRDNDTGESFTGQITVSEVIDGFEDVLDMPQLGMTVDAADQADDQNLQVLVQGVIGPDGEPIEIFSHVPNVPAGSLVAIFDSGFTLPQIPHNIAEAFYGRVQGAFLTDGDDAKWILPCDQLLEVSFIIGDNEYPIHPLDMNSVSLAEGEEDAGDGMCVGPFQPTTAGAEDPNIDMILGMAFLRNAYALFDYGDFINATSNDQGPPFVQLLSITDPDAARQDFIDIRLGGNDITDQPQFDLLPSNTSFPSSDAANVSFSGISVIDAGDSFYAANITLDGKMFTVTLDTGSSDLFLFSDVPGAQNLGKPLDNLNASLQFAIGAVQGPIHTAQLEFGDNTVQNQAFLLADPSGRNNSPSGKFDGLLGLGPPGGSVISGVVGDSRGDYALQRIFDLNQTSDNFITILLSRANDTTEASEGLTSQITISEVIAGFEDVTDMPQLGITIVKDDEAADQHLQVLVDSITGPDGSVYQFDSHVANVPAGSAVAVFDSGFTLPQVPVEVSNLIYGRIPNAQFDPDDGVWLLPCDQLIEVSFSIGGNDYPIHPEDVNSAELSTPDLLANNTCVGLFQPIIDTAQDPNFDMILGMAFLRNVYALFDYGAFIDGTSDDQQLPFAQLLSTTDGDQARTDFINQRLGGVDTTGDASHQLVSANEAIDAAVVSHKAKNKIKHGVKVAIIVAAAVGVLVVLGLLACCCCCCRSRRSGRGKSRMLNLKGTSVLPGAKGSYQTLEAPAPGRY